VARSLLMPAEKRGQGREKSAGGQNPFERGGGWCSLIPGSRFFAPLICKPFFGVHPERLSFTEPGGRLALADPDRQAFRRYQPPPPPPPPPPSRGPPPPGGGVGGGGGGGVVGCGGGGGVVFGGVWGGDQKPKTSARASRAVDGPRPSWPGIVLPRRGAGSPLLDRPFPLATLPVTVVGGENRFVVEWAIGPRLLRRLCSETT